MLPSWFEGGLGYFKERYHLVVEGPGLHRVLKAPLWNFYADPFPLQEGERRCLIFEEFEGLKNKGRLRTVCLETGLLETALETDYHLSYPFVFRYQDQWWMVPESHRNNSLDLYRCVEFPARWEHVRCLMSGMQVADTNVVFREGRVWLVGSLNDSEGQYLALFSSSDLLTGEWIPHPVNTERRYLGRPHLSGRNAGPHFRVGERLIRPSQYNPRFYGESIILNEITRWDESSYEERPWSWLHYPRRSGTCHHLCLEQDRMVYDLRAAYPYPWLRFPRSTPAPEEAESGGWERVERMLKGEAFLAV